MMEEGMMMNIADRLVSGEKLSSKTLRKIWKEKQNWPEDYSILLARRALAMGENFLAYDIAETVVPRSERMKIDRLHIMALALARSGSLARAAELLVLLPKDDDSEIVGLKSRIIKDMAINCHNETRRRRYFECSGKLSLEIYEKQRLYYNGINAASCLFMAGERQRATALVLEKVLPSCKQCAEPDLWEYATLGECYLLLQDFQTAQIYYSRASELAVKEGKLGSFSSTLKQMKMLLAELGVEDSPFISALKLPAIGIFTGHMIDRPERRVPRFPASAENHVRRQLHSAIRERNIQLSFSSCACGGDILFLEEILAQGGECHITPPLPLETTIRNSVDYLPGSDWKGRLEKILAHENVLLQEAECDEIGMGSDALVYDFTNRYILGQALMKHREFSFPIFGLAVWDGKASGLVGGTDSAVEHWKNAGIEYSIISPEVKNG